MIWTIFYTRPDNKNILWFSENITKAVYHLLWLKQNRILHHILYGVDQMEEN